jgi:hypothetical protein
VLAGNISGGAIPGIESKTSTNRDRKHSAETSDARREDDGRAEMPPKMVAIIKEAIVSRAYASVE